MPLNKASAKPIVIGFFVFILYLVGNGFLHASSKMHHTKWSVAISSKPLWMDTLKTPLDFAPDVTLDSDAVDPTLIGDHYQALALSAKALPLTTYIQSTYSVSAKDAVIIIAAVLRYSDEHKIAPELLLGVIDKESSFRIDARSSTGARGLMQVLPSWHQNKITVDGGSNELLWSPEFNIKIGAQILKEYLNRSKGNINEALARYNGSLGMHNGYPEGVLRAQERYRRYTTDLRT